MVTVLDILIKTGTMTNCVVNVRTNQEEFTMVQNRNIAVCIILTIVTCGLYGWYWLVCLANDVNTVSGRTNDASGGMVLLLTIVTCNIYHIYWMYKAGEKIDAARQMRGIPSQNNGVLYLILTLIGFGWIAWALLQSELNNMSGAPGAY